MKKKQKYIIIILLVAFSAIAFGRIAGNDFVNYDDPRLITAHNIVKSGFNTESIKWALTDIRDEYWHPLTSLSLVLDWQLFGENATGHHLVSLLWHIGAVLLLFLFLNKTTGQLWPSAFAAAIFALHPLRVESVAWASERKDVLSMFFGMATLYAYAFYVEDRKISKYLLCLFMFILGLMSKPILVTLPFVLLLLDYWPLERWPSSLNAHHQTTVDSSRTLHKKNKKNKTVVKVSFATVKNADGSLKNLLVEKLPFFLLSIILGIQTVLGLKTSGYLYTLDQLLFSDRVINSVVSYFVYIRKFFWPVDLAVFYPYQSLYSNWQIFGAASFLIVITITVLFFRKKTPFLLIGWFWYLGTLFPVIGLLQTGIQTKADRYTYLPAIGIAIMLVWGIIHLMPKEKMRKIILLPAAVIVTIALTILTWQQCGHWKDSISLFRHALNVTEDNFVAHINYGAALAASRKHDDAIHHFRKAINIVPDNHVAHLGLVNSLFIKKEYAEAVKHAEGLIKLYPTLGDAHKLLISSLVEQGKTDEAIKHCRETIKLNQNYGFAHFQLAKLLVTKGKQDEAIDHFQQAININPGDTDAHHNLANLLTTMGKTQQAVPHYREAIKNKPDYFEAYYNLAEVLEQQQKETEAIEYFREAARINPSSFKALNNLGVLLERKQRHDEAIHYYQKAQQIEPENAGLHFNLGIAFGNKGNLEKAIEHFKKAIELNPNFTQAQQALNLAKKLASTPKQVFE